MAGEGDGWVVEGYACLCNDGRCEQVEFRTVLRPDGRGRVEVGPLIFPVTPGMQASRLLDDFYAAIFASHSAREQGGCAG